MNQRNELLLTAVLVIVICALLGYFAFPVLIGFLLIVLLCL